jgi:hypothetical protein
MIGIKGISARTKDGFIIKLSRHDLYPDII